MIKLNEMRTEAEVNGFTFKVGQELPYKPSESEQLGIGRITELRHPGYQASEKDSVWMCVADVVEGYGNWVSCLLWVEQKRNGLFDDKIETAVKNDTNTNNKPADVPAEESELW